MASKKVVGKLLSRFTKKFYGVCWLSLSPCVSPFVSEFPCEFIGFSLVKKETVNIVRGLTGSEDGLLSLSNYASSVLPLLSRILSDDKEVSEPAAEALVNLPQNAGLAAKMVEMGMIKIAMDLFYKPGFSITRLLVMLLVNLTQLDDGISSLLQVQSWFASRLQESTWWTILFSSWHEALASQVLRGVIILLFHGSILSDFLGSYFIYSTE